MIKKGYIYIEIPKSEIELYLIDITYDIKYDINIKKKNILIYKKVYNPNKVKKHIYNKFIETKLLNNIFSCIKIKEIIYYINNNIKLV